MNEIDCWKGYKKQGTKKGKNGKRVNNCVKEDGRIVKGVNTTVDVGVNEIPRQAEKFGNKVSKDGYPPSMSPIVKPKATTVKENNSPRYTAYEWALIEGGHVLDKPTPSISALAKKHNVSTGTILKQLEKGIEVEYEHTSDFDIAKEIALDHLSEFPDYYTRLKKAETESVREFRKAGDLFAALTEGVIVQLERGDDMDILHFRDSKKPGRVEVRGKKGYEAGGYDPKDPLHQTLDKLGKAANISDLMNGEKIAINPHHPHGKRALDTAQKVMSEEEGAQPITPPLLKKLEFHIDKMFASLGMDVEFTRHFLDRVNDPRNQRQITVQELARLFKETYRKWGKKISQMGPDAQAVIKDMQTDINLPFVLNWDKQNQQLDLVAKTIMRKKNFTTPNQQLPLENTANEKAPPGREKQVKKLKGKFDDPGAPYAIAWAQHNKSGKPKKK